MLRSSTLDFSVDARSPARAVRVCFLIDDLARAGTESQLLALIRSLDRRRVEPFLCLLRSGDSASRELEPPGVPVYRVGVESFRRSGTIAQALRFARFLREQRIDVLQTYFPDSSLFGVLVGWLAGVPCRVRTRNNIGHARTYWRCLVGRLLNPLTTLTLANCQAAKHSLLEDEHPDPRSVIVMENGVDLSRFDDITPLPEGPWARPCVAAVANLRHVKGLDLLVEAAARVRQCHPDVNFIVAGEGEERPALEELIASRGLTDCFTLAGSVSDVPGLLSRTHVAVLCSRAEGMPNALLEYMAAGRAVVAASVGAVPSIIEHGVNGLLASPGDAACLAGGIEQLLADTRLAARLGAVARQHVREHYSRQTMVSRFEKLYIGLAGRNAVVARSPGVVARSPGVVARSPGVVARSPDRVTTPAATEAGDVEDHRSKKRDVLTDVPGSPGRFWGDHTTFVGPTDPPGWLRRLLGERWSFNLIRAVAAVRLFARRRRCSGVVTGGGADGMLFAWLQSLWPWGRKRHVLVDCNWQVPRSRLGRFLRRLRLRWAARSADKLVVWASHEVDDYAEAFGIPREKLVYVPFHDTVSKYTYEVRDEGYLFAGGNYDRDYRCLIEAVRPLDLPVWIATTRTEQLEGVDIPPHVRVEGTSASGFRQAMAAARLVVIPMQGGLLHSGGQQTCLNAMLMGKPTIAVGRKWATDLMEDGTHGLIVDYDDPQALRSAIEWVLDHPGEARAMAERGKQHAARFTTRRTMETIYRLATQH